MPKAFVNGVNINYHEAGDGFPFLLIHGLSDSFALWSPLIPKLSSDYRTIALDLRGHGGSDKPDTPYTVRLFTEDALSLLQRLEIRNAHVMGLSLGAAIAQQLALDHPETVRSLILLSPFSYNDPDSRRKLEMLRETARRDGVEAFFDMAVKLVVTPKFLSTNAGAIAEAKKDCVKTNSKSSIIHAVDACLQFDARDRTSQISQPTLIISGREDALTPVHLAEQIHLTIKSSRWEIMEGVGHNLLVSDNVPQLASIIVGFVKHHNPKRGRESCPKT